MPVSDAAVAQLRREVAAVAARTLPEQDAGAFAERAGSRLGRVVDLLGALYSDRADPAVLARDLFADAAELAGARSAGLRALDRRRAADPGWFQEQRMIGYVCYVDRFAETLPGLRSRLDYLAELGITYLHLMPVLAPRPGDNDGGYAVADYDAVDPRLGEMADLTALAGDLHARGMALCVDLVLNHTAREHPWAQRALAGEAHYRDFYFVFPDRSRPDAFEQTVPDIFPELAPGSFTYVPEMNGWVWTTFRDYQWDLDYGNPAVLRAMLRTMLTLANRGADVLRLDAAPFLWKRLGTNCQNQPEAHLLLQLFRALVTVAAPGVLLKAEAMVSPDLLTQYLGDHGDYRPECDLAYDNQLMVMLWSMLATGTSDLARQALTRRSPAPEPTSWVTYLRCHDDIGWAVTKADAAAVGLVGREHRRFLSQFYAGAAPGSFARGVVFQKAGHGGSPISGMAASLCGVDAALAAGDDAGLATALARLEALYSVVYSFGGIPLVYMGDEIALRNDPNWSDDPAHRFDNRWIHRPPMDWTAAARRSQPGTVEGHMFRAMRALGAARAASPALRSNAPAAVIDAATDAVFAYRRGPVGGRAVLAVVDVQGAGRLIARDVLRAAGVETPALYHTGVHPARLADDGLHLPPYGFAWLTD
jgi:amylosucrase